jgi:uncharacterized Zn finger protein
MMTCPDCSGTGYTVALVKYQGGCFDGGCLEARLICRRCNESGSVTEQQHEAYKRGKAMREDRRRRRVSMHEEAERLGLSLKDYNDLEHGRAQP